MAKYSKEQRPPPTPKQPKPWDAPPAPLVGDRNANDVYLAVGVALTNWELMEHALGEVFVALVAGRSYEAMRAYSAVLANSARLEMIGGAAEAFFLTRSGEPYNALRTRLKNLLAGVEGFSRRRNEIAHGVIGVMFPDGAFDKDDDEPEHSFVLTPSILAKRNRKMFRVLDTGMIGFSPMYQYSSVEIDAMSAKFRDLGPEAGKLANAIRRQRSLERQASLQKSPSPPRGR